MGITMQLLFVMLGGFLGTLSRYALGEWLPTSEGFPLTTLLVNLFGCLFLGWFFTFVGQNQRIDPLLVLAIGTGLIGSFTTFSAFSLETVKLLQSGDFLSALLYVLTTILCGLLFTYIGYKIALKNKVCESL